MRHENRPIPTFNNRNASAMTIVYLNLDLKQQYDHLSTMTVSNHCKLQVSATTYDYFGVYRLNFIQNIGNQPHGPKSHEIVL